MKKDNKPAVAPQADTSPFRVTVPGDPEDEPQKRHAREQEEQKRLAEQRAATNAAREKSDAEARATQQNKPATPATGEE